ncbi:MAG TPA: hydrogenase maturation protease [Terriglobales bacterium]|nr:hydrogenase maturation protease [Terriglobales bacterium]
MTSRESTSGLNPILVIAYGNPLRNDDGVAWRVAELLRQKFPASQTICVHQLTPDLAQDVSQAAVVVFIDAEDTENPGRVRCQGISPKREEFSFSHHLTPSALLGLSETLYGSAPRATLVAISGENFDHGEILSEYVAHALPQVSGEIVKHL